MKKGVFASRKGAALESAIAFMMITFALCSVIVTASMMIKTRDMREREKFGASAALDAIGESFTAHIKSTGTGEGFSAGEDYPEPEIRTETFEEPPMTEFSLVLKDGDGETLLEVGVRKLWDGTFEVFRWNKYI